MRQCFGPQGEQGSFFHDELVSRQEAFDMSAHFDAYYKRVWRVAQSLPMVIHHLPDLVAETLKHLQVSS